METLGSYLEQDHAHCDQLFKTVNRSVRTMRWLQAAHDMGAYQNALERHLLIEERIVFPAYEKALGNAVTPTASMRAEHLRIRAVAQRLRDAVRDRDGDAFLDHAEALLLVMHQHSEKEEGILYPRIERVLAGVCADLLKAARAFGAYDGATYAA